MTLGQFGGLRSEFDIGNRWNYLISYYSSPIKDPWFHHWGLELRNINPGDSQSQSQWHRKYPRWLTSVSRVRYHVQRLSQDPWDRGSPSLCCEVATCPIVHRHAQWSRTSSKLKWYI